MASSYTAKLRLELPATAELVGSWGNRVNLGITSMIEEAIAGRAEVTHSNAANYTLTINNAASDEARPMILDIGGIISAARNVVCPTQSKLYVAKNSTTGGFAVTLKTSAGTGISIPNGKTAIVYCDGTNVVNAMDYFSSIATTTGSFSGQITSTVATGSAPFVVASTTQVSNLNVSQLEGGTWASPGAAVGTGTPVAATFTTLGTAGAITQNVDAGGDAYHHLKRTATTDYACQRYYTAGVEIGRIGLVGDSTDLLGIWNAGVGAIFTVNTANSTATFGGAVVMGAFNFSINTNKFTVAGGTGNTVVAGTLNVTGAITGTLTGSATSATTAGTVTTAAQPAITSVGTLTTLSTTSLKDDGGNLIISSTNPTVASGFGTGPTVTGNNTAAFKITVGTAPGSAGVVTMPSAPNGWSAFAINLTNNAGTHDAVILHVATTQTSMSFQQVSAATGLDENFTAGDVLLFQCMAF